MPDGGLALDDTAAGYTCRLLDAMGQERSTISLELSDAYSTTLVADAMGRALIAIKGLIWVVGPAPARELTIGPLRHYRRELIA
jgi:hypothetical protein